MKKSWEKRLGTCSVSVWMSRNWYRWASVCVCVCVVEGNKDWRGWKTCWMLDSLVKVLGLIPKAVVCQFKLSMLYLEMWRVKRKIWRTGYWLKSSDFLVMKFRRQRKNNLLLFRHVRLPCPSSPGACSNSCPLCQWCHPTISSSVVPFSFSCLQPFPASGSYLMSWFFTSGGQSIGASASASVLLNNIQDWFQDWLVWYPYSSRHSQKSSPTPQFKTINFVMLNLFYGPTLTSIHDYWKNYSFEYTERHLLLGRELWPT